MYCFLSFIYGTINIEVGDNVILVIVGPTAVGKTKLSIELSKIYNGEVVNADSTQVYKGLDIGTAKVTKEEKCGVVHHLFDIKEVNENYTVFDYQKDAREKIDEIKGRGHIPVFVGGTGFYLKAAFYDYQFLEEESEDSTKYQGLTDEELEEKIESYECGFSYDKHNRRRMIRLLARLERGWLPQDERFILQYPDVLFIGLTTDRDVLYERINERFDKMLVPLIDEVKPFILSGVESKALRTAIGYKEFYPFFENKKTLQEVVEDCKKNSRNYAKRQYTWFQNQMNVKWFSVDYEDFNKTVREVVEYIESIHFNDMSC